MSLMVDLLARVRSSDQSRQEIPPQLRELLNRRSGKPVARIGLALLGVLCAGLLLGGLYVVFQPDVSNDTAGPLLPRDSSRNRIVREAQASPAEVAVGRPSERTVPAVSSGETRVPAESPKPSQDPPAKRPAGERPRSQEDVSPAAVKMETETPNEKKEPEPPAQGHGPVPRSELSALGLADENIRKGNVSDEALASGSPAAVGVPGLLEFHLYAGRDAELRGDMADALESYLKALELSPRDPDILNRVAYVYLRLGRAGDSLEYSKRALTVRPGFVSALINGGIGHMETGSPELAQELFSQAVQADPTNRKVLLNVGLAYERMGKSQEALEIYRRLSRTGDDEAPLHEARVLETTGQLAEALAVYEGILAGMSVSSEVRTRAERRLKALTSPINRETFP